MLQAGRPKRDQDKQKEGKFTPKNLQTLSIDKLFLKFFDLKICLRNK